MPVDSITLLYGQDFRDRPEVRRALELADTRWRTLADTSMDNTEQHRKFLTRTARELLDTSGEEIAIDALRRGMGTGETPRNAPQPGGRVVDHGNGRGCTVYLDDEVQGSGLYGINTTEEQARRAGRPHIGSPEMTTKRAPNGHYGDPDKFPGVGDERDRRARIEQHAKDSRGGYIYGAEVEGNSRRYVEQADPQGRYGDPRTYPYRDPWRS